MKEIKNQCAQGDVLFRRVESLPKEAVERERRGAIVVAHSETGHHHVINSPDAKLFGTADPFVCYLRLEAGVSVDVEHLRPHDTHETVRLLGDKERATIFEVRRQREHAPEGWRMVTD